jgi:hypothetical protein
MSDEQKKHRPEIIHPQAPAFDSKRMLVARSVEDELYVHLTETEALERGQEAARKRSEARSMADDLAAHGKQVRADIKALENRAQHLERECELEARRAMVRCDVIFDYAANEARTVRTDTNQLLGNRTRTLQKHEIEQFQTSLALVPPSTDAEPAAVLDFRAHLDDPTSLTDGILTALQRAGKIGHTEPELRAVLFGSGHVKSNDTKERAAIQSELVIMRNDGRITGKKGKRWYIVESGSE